MLQAIYKVFLMRRLHGAKTSALSKLHMLLQCRPRHTQDVFDILPTPKICYAFVFMLRFI